MGNVFTITVLLALSLALTAQQPGMHADANPVAEGEIKALELKLAGLIVRGEWDEYARHLASDYLHTRDNGYVEGKDEAMASLRDGKRKLIAMEIEPGEESREVMIRRYGGSEVLVKVKVASIWGTDLHIYEWDRWAQGRIHPPLIPGHEFCGEVVAFGDEVTSVKEGDFVSAEMHVACGKCLQCRTGEAHICQNVKIIGVDSDGAFAEYVVIPESNIWKLDPAIPQEYASILDPLGNAVHAVLAGEIAAKTVAITGCRPIGLFSIAVARARGATTTFPLKSNKHHPKNPADI